MGQVGNLSMNWAYKLHDLVHQIISRAKWQYNKMLWNFLLKVSDTVHWSKAVNSFSVISLSILVYGVSDVYFLCFLDKLISDVYGAACPW